MNKKLIVPGICSPSVLIISERGGDFINVGITRYFRIVAFFKIDPSCDGNPGSVAPGHDVTMELNEIG